MTGPENTLHNALEPMLSRGSSATWAQLGKAALQHLGRDVPQNDVEVCRAMTADKSIGDVITAGVNSAIYAGFASEPDSTISWTVEMSAADFKESELFLLASGSRLERIPRGGTAPQTGFDFAGLTYRVGRFGAKFTLDAQDMVDGQHVGAVMFAVEQLGRAARRVRSDLVFSLILQNPVLPYDDTAMFHADHSNLGSAVLGSAGLSTGMAALGNATLSDDHGYPIHVNNGGALLVVPPDSAVASKALLHTLALGGSQDIALAVESRIGGAGLADPTDGTLRVGLSTNWLLAATRPSVPAVVVCALDGNFLPDVSRFSLEGDGRYGVGWAVKLDLAVVAASHDAVYWSSGTG
ncbi:MAG: hypothetical protein A2V70_18160 [Planctomycetes bacterium RBG_13_63_9]|nr:MAG: hypothetical protein A2V70_18160 [Planctomycetes bacterium RBG_13_63_9]